VDELSAFVSRDTHEPLVGALPRARMKIKQPRFDSEMTSLFHFEISLEWRRTKNVIELSVLRSGPEICLDGASRRVWMKNQRRDRSRDLAVNMPSNA
jgi:hypothetical protein